MGIFFNRLTESIFYYSLNIGDVACSYRKCAMWRNEMVTFGDVLDFFEWREKYRSIPRAKEKVELQDYGCPVIRVYNTGTKLCTVNRKGKLFKLREKLHQGKSLRTVPGVTQSSKSVIITFTGNSVTLYYSDSEISQTMHIPAGEVCTMYECFVTERRMITGVCKGKLIGR